MRLVSLMSIVMMCAWITIPGCAPLGGQGVAAYADDHGQVNMYVYILDGGTDLGGLFYRPSGGTLVRGGLPDRDDPEPPEPQPTTQPTTQPQE